MSEDNIITLNNKQYIEVDPNAKDIKPAVKTDHVIIIAQRGWIFEGYKDKKVKDKIQLLNANVVRKWTNGRGIGGLTYDAYKKEYTLDPVGTISFANEAIIAEISITEW
ncbi:hypothetical protein [Caudoviricetes sp.]|nr:hypothetical protein [Caudoviricetes sp.]